MDRDLKKLEGHKDWEVTRVFLESEGVYKKFIDNLDEVDVAENEETLIDQALYWSATEEGHPFWSEINKKLISFMRSENAERYVKIGKFLDESSCKKEFIDFLTKKDACKKYFNNFDLDWDHSTVKTQLIDVFGWGPSPEGLDFWDELDKDWKELISAAPKEDIASTMEDTLNVPDVNTKPIGEYEALVRNDEEWEETASFLKTEGAYDKFVINVINSDRAYICDGGTLIARSIHWYSTPEGYVFWDELNNKYLERNKEKPALKTDLSSYIKSSKPFEKYEPVDDISGSSLVHYLDADDFDRYVKKFGYYDEMEWNDENFTWIKENIEDWEDILIDFIKEIEDQEDDRVMFWYSHHSGEIHVLTESSERMFIWLNTESMSLEKREESSKKDAIDGLKVKKFNSFSEGYKWMLENKPDDYDCPF